MRGRRKWSVAYPASKKETVELLTIRRVTSGVGGDAGGCVCDEAVARVVRLGGGVEDRCSIKALLLKDMSVLLSLGK